MEHKTKISIYLCLVLLVMIGNEFIVANGQEPAKLHVFLRELVYGVEVPNLRAKLYKEGEMENDWLLVSETISSEEGIINFPLKEDDFTIGNYRVVYMLEEFYLSINLTTFYPYVEFVFEKTSSESKEELAIPMWSSPYGFTTYKGSWSQ